VADEAVRRGVRIGVDVGSVRVGVARSDPSGLVATPVETVRRAAGTAADVDRIAAIVAEEEAFEVVVGLPRTLRGEEGSAAQAARQYATAIAERVAPVPVRLVDERLSTVSAHRTLREAGVRGRRQRPVVDQVAAVVILQSALDAERASGRAPGALVAPGPAPERPAPSGEEGGDT
jgi:putative Holliday junction resolvase